METYLCQLEHADDGVNATVKSVFAGELQIRHGMGETIADALSNAMGVNSAVFASLSDERDACVAALRGRSVRFAIDGRELHSCGLA